MGIHPKTARYIADREAGMKYRDIAAKYGVSYQCVAAACAQHSPNHFRKYTKDEVIYPNLRNWLNENQVTRAEFLRRLDNMPYGSGICRTSAIFKGTTGITKDKIDRILAVTGMKYEELFALD